MKFEGQFTPPKMGNQHVPIPVSGPGYIEAKSEHLVISGFSSPPSHSGLIGLGVVLLIIGAGFLSGGWIPSEVLIGAAVLVIGWVIGKAMTGSSEHKEDKPALLEVPWEKIKKIHIETDMVLIVIKKFKPKGAIYFTPQDSAKRVTEELSEFTGPNR